MASITVSGLSEESLERLEKRAAIYGRSVEDEALHILKRAIGPDQEEREARMKEAVKELSRLRDEQAEWQKKNGVNAEHKTSLQIIREDRDSDHGRLYDPWGLDDPGN